MRRLLPLLALLCLLAPLRAQVDSLYDSSITLGAACRTAPALVLAVISDRKIARDTDANGTRDFGVYPERSRRETDVISYSDYDPGVYPERSRRGTTLPGRTGYNGSTNPNHRYGFQGEACPERSRRESDDEMYGDGNAIAFTYRVHDARIGRFLSVDPLAPEYPFYSPYAFSGNRVMDAVELEGLEELILHKIFQTPSGKTIINVLRSTAVYRNFAETLRSQTKYDVYIVPLIIDKIYHPDDEVDNPNKNGYTTKGKGGETRIFDGLEEIKSILDATTKMGKYNGPQEGQKYVPGSVFKIWYQSQHFRYIHIDDVIKSFQEDKSLIVVGINMNHISHIAGYINSAGEIITNSSVSPELIQNMIVEAAFVLAHELDSHAINTLNGNDLISSVEHDAWYSYPVGNTSPSIDELITDERYRASRAYKVYLEVRSSVKQVKRSENK